MNDRYGREEELGFSWPLPLPDDATVCDFGSCMKAAAHVLPGAYVCSDCLAQYTVDTQNGARYSIPMEKLAVSVAGRQRRRRDYGRVLDALRADDGGVVRTDDHDHLLDELIKLAVDSLIRSAGASP